MLIPCILQKVPEQLRLEITKNLSGDNLDFDEVLNVFNDELSAREKYYFVNKPEKVYDGHVIYIPVRVYILRRLRKTYVYIVEINNTRLGNVKL